MPIIAVEMPYRSICKVNLETLARPRTMQAFQDHPARFLLVGGDPVFRM